MTSTWQVSPNTAHQFTVAYKHTWRAEQDVPPPPMINEFVFNHTGADTKEFVEIAGT
jgi:hypothetical protein